MLFTPFFDTFCFIFLLFFNFLINYEICVESNSSSQKNNIRFGQCPMQFSAHIAVGHAMCSLHATTKSLHLLAPVL